MGSEAEDKPRAPTPERIPDDIDSRSFKDGQRGNYNPPQVPSQVRDLYQEGYRAGALDRIAKLLVSLNEILERW